MPIYEYRCRECGRKASLFFRSLARVETNPACPHCGEVTLERLISRVWSRSRGANAIINDSDMSAFGSNDYPSGTGDLDDDSAFYGDFGEEDVAAFAREARAMAQAMGEPLDADLDHALQHIERGADPDDVFGELDAAEQAGEDRS